MNFKYKANYASFSIYFVYSTFFPSFVAMMHKNEKDMLLFSKLPLDANEDEKILKKVETSDDE